MTTHKPFAFFGTPYVARNTLAYLVERGYRPSVVITSPDAPRGRGQVMAPSETKAWAAEHGFPVLSPEKLGSEAIDAIRAYGCEYAVVVAYGKILPQALIDSFPKGAINVHYSLLPKYRGASPVEAALRNGDTVTGVALQQMVYELDAGDILAVKETAIDPSETARELRPRLVQLGAELLADTLPAFEAGSVVPVPQDHEAATRSGKIRKEEGELDLAGDPVRNWNTYRAFAESPGTYFFAQRNGARIRVKIRTARFADDAFVPERIVPEGKGEMDYADFARSLA